MKHHCVAKRSFCICRYSSPEANRIVAGVLDGQSTPAATCLEGGASEGRADTWLKALLSMIEEFLLSRTALVKSI